MIRITHPIRVTIRDLFIGRRPSAPETSEERAKKLLYSYLSEHQRSTLGEYGYFFVQGKNGKYYVLMDGWRFYSLDRKGRVRKEHHGGIVWDHRQYSLPSADSLLAQKLSLESNPYDLLRKACSRSSTVPILNLPLSLYYESFKAFKKTLPKSRWRLLA